MGSAWFLLLFFSPLATAAESCIAAAHTCTEGVDTVVEESRSMLALKKVSKVSPSIPEQSKADKKNTKELHFGRTDANEGRAGLIKCVDDRAGLICEHKGTDSKERFEFFRFHAELDKICIKKWKHVCEGTSKHCWNQVVGWTEDLKVQCRPPDTFRLNNVRGGGSKCLDLDMSSNNIIVWDCHNHNNQRWYQTGSQLRSLARPELCATMKGHNVEATTCNRAGADGQYVYSSGEELQIGKRYSDNKMPCVGWDWKWWRINVIAEPCSVYYESTKWKKSEVKRGEGPLK